MKNHKKRVNNGFTLIELIVTLAILTIVLSVVFSMFMFSNRTYNKGVDQYDIQSSVRLASDFIIDELRFASEIKILDSIGIEKINDPINGIGTYDNYIFVTNGKVVRQSRYHSKAIQVGNNGAIEFSGVGNKILGISIESSDNQQTYNIDSNIQPLNLKLGAGKIEGVDNGSVLFFRSIDNYEALKALPEATLGPNTDPKSIAIGFSKTIDSAEIIFEFTNPSDPGLYSISSDSDSVTVEVPSGAASGTFITIRVNLDEFEIGALIDFYYTLIYDESTWTIK